MLVVPVPFKPVFFRLIKQHITQKYFCQALNYEIRIILLTLGKIICEKWPKIKIREIGEIR